MSDRPYTDADVKTVKRVLSGTSLPMFPEHDRRYERDARAVLDALTAAGWLRGHCPSCECPDVPYDGPPPTHRLVIDPGGTDG